MEGFMFHLWPTMVGYGYFITSLLFVGLLLVILHRQHLQMKHREDSRQHQLREQRMSLTHIIVHCEHGECVIVRRHQWRFFRLRIYLDEERSWTPPTGITFDAPGHILRSYIKWCETGDLSR